MLARRLSTILPALTLAKALETPRIPRVAGLTGDQAAVVTTCLFPAPHHPASDVDRLGGRPVAVPGARSRTPHGALASPRWRRAHATGATGTRPRERSP
jgi:magnesium chelatase family protein